MKDKNFSVLDWKKGELIFVVGVMLSIFLVSVIQLRESQMKTRDAQRKADVGLINRALAQYEADHQLLPAEKDGQILACGSRGAEPCLAGMQIQDDKGIVYLKTMPQDPLAYKGYKYVYERDLEGKKFRLYIAMEFGRDPEKRTDLTMKCGDAVQCNWYVENK